jgi:hypothetical protein
MAGTNTDYVLKFMNESFHKVSDNGINLIIKWYLRFLSNPMIFEKILIEYKSEKTKARTQIEKHFASIIDPKKELKEIEDLKQTKGEEFLRDEIHDYILKHRINQTEITEMTGLSICTITRFFLKNTTTKENTNYFVYRWYFRYSKHPHIFQQAFSRNVLNKRIQILHNQSIDNGDRSQTTTCIFTEYVICHILIISKIKPPM